MAKKHTSFKPAAGLFEGEETEVAEAKQPEVQPFSEGMEFRVSEVSRAAKPCGAKCGA